MLHVGVRRRVVDTNERKRNIIFLGVEQKGSSKIFTCMFIKSEWDCCSATKLRFPGCKFV